MTVDRQLTQFIEDAAELYEEAQELLISKQVDYGPNNIRLSPFGPYVGLIVRLQDKLSRAANIVALPIGEEPKHESLRDTFIDIMNYGAIGVMLLDATFPKAKENHIND